MKLTPLDIKKQEFKKSMRGYDPVEVDAFLEMVADELEGLIREKSELSDEVLKLKTQLRDYQNVEKTLQETLVSAQESIKESKENSSREAEMVIREAELKAEKILEAAKLKLAEMKNELVVVKAQKDSFARRLRHLLESQLELIQVLELDDLGFGKHDGRRTTESRELNYEEEKIEFEGVDDMLPEEQISEAEPVKAVETDEPHGIKWGKRDSVSENDEKNPTEDQKKSRISDQLIL